MLRSVYGRTLHDSRRAIVGWIAGIVAYAGFLIAFYPTIRNQAEFADLSKHYPESLRKLFGISDITSATGYLHAELFSIVMPMLFIIYAVLAGGDATAGEEERRTIDLLLANPITRTRVILEKYAALATVVVAMGAALVATILVGGLAADLRPDSWHLVQATGGIVLLALGFGSIALALGAWTGRRGLARGVTAALASATYLIGTLALIVSALYDYRYASPFYYAVSAQPLRNGLGPGYALVLVAIVVIPVAIAVRQFERRDVAT